MLDISQGKSQSLPVRPIVSTSTSPLGETEGGQERHDMGPLVGIVLIMNFPTKLRLLQMKTGEYGLSPQMSVCQVTTLSISANSADITDAGALVDLVLSRETSRGKSKIIRIDGK